VLECSGVAEVTMQCASNAACYGTVATQLSAY